MLFAAQAASEVSSAGHVWTAVGTVIVGLTAVIVNAHSDSLRKAERLTEIAAAMPDSSERRLVENLRDDYVTSWALNQMAPTHNWRRTAFVAGYVVGGFTLLMWWAYSVTTQYALWTWLLYGLGIAISAGAAVAHGKRNALRSRWIRSERSNRWMRLPHHTRLREATRER